jgi:enolase
MPTIRHLSALEILDSRGRPTVRATCRLEAGIAASVSVPAGASTGRAEALELRDGDPSRYGGAGCRKAVYHVGSVIAQALEGRDFAHQRALDEALCELDGTPNKARLGANAVLAVSLAFARAHAAARGEALYAHFADLAGVRVKTLPRLTVNLFSGGLHAGGQTAIQDVLVVPTADTIDEGLAAVHATYYAAARLIREKYGMRLLTADEGGLAPEFPSTEAMLEDAVEAIRRAGSREGEDVFLAVDVAASHFYREGAYHLGEERLDSAGMIERIAGWVARHPIVSVEDGLAEDDWSAWPALHQRLRGSALTLGDDLLCTNPERIRRAIEASAADALLLKVNQIGTLTEAAEALRLARGAGWHVTISARSGETEDDWLGDLAVGWQGEQIKVGSIQQSERLSKYNRLLEIEAAARLPVVGWPAAT